jgi:uncharacterized surface protein with fasciclin (FAS1) repeats
MKNIRFGMFVLSVIVIFGCKQETTVPKTQKIILAPEEVLAIEKQILPDNMMDRLFARPEVSNFTKGIDRTEASEMLQKEKGPFTLLALLNSEIDTLKPPKTFQKYLIKEKVTSAMMVQRNRRYEGGYKLKTMEGEFLTVAKLGDTILVINKGGDTLQIGKSDILASNGIIHLVSTFKRRLPLE